MSHRKTLSNEANFWQDFFFFFNVFLTLGLHNNNKLGKIRVAPLSSSSETTAAAAKCSHFCRTLLRTRLTDLAVAAVAAVSYKVFPFTPLLLPSSFFLSPSSLLPPSPSLLLTHLFTPITSPTRRRRRRRRKGKARQSKTTMMMMTDLHFVELSASLHEAAAVELVETADVAYSLSPIHRRPCNYN